MDNQHRKIVGYRELTQEDIDLMNEIKNKGAELEYLLTVVTDRIDLENAQFGAPDAEPRRWVAIAKTHLQQGLMALTRAVARPNFF